MHNNLLELKNAIQNQIGIDCEIFGDSDSEYSNLYIRSSEPDFKPPKGWFVHVEKIKETFRLEFEFDNSAGLLCKFYFNKLISQEVSDNIFELQENFNRNYFPLSFISDEVFVSLEEMKKIDSPLNFKIKAKGRFQDSSDFYTKSRNVILDFLLLSIFPLLPGREDKQTQDFLYEQGLPEGASKQVIVNRYERDPRNRLACIKHYGTSCIVCGFDFGKIYGNFAADYIHVHHLVPVSQMNVSYTIDPVSDLVPLCPNCHSAVHMSNPPLTPDELRSRLLK